MIEDIKKLVETGKLKKIEEAVKAAVDGGANPSEVLESMTAAMDTVGEKFQKNEIYVPEMLVAAKTMQRGVNVLKPALGAGAAAKFGKFVIATGQESAEDCKQINAMRQELCDRYKGNDADYWFVRNATNSIMDWYERRIKDEKKFVENNKQFVYATDVELTAASLEEQNEYKKDILDCIDKNIVDKDIALAIIEQCEIDAANFIKEGRWAGIPFIGSIRVSKHHLMTETPEQQALIKEAQETLDSNKYILFRTELGRENDKHIRQERYYRYIVSIAVSHNKKLYKKLCEERKSMTCSEPP